MIPGFRAALGFLSGVAGASVVVAASANNINLFALCGSPGSPGTYTVTINSGVVIGSSSTATAAVISGTFPNGSLVTLINKGSIYGKEGPGGTGATFNVAASAGSPAGPAVSLSYALTVDNTSGNIFGGGGGGAGGDAAVFNDVGGNGGDGQGFTNQSAPGTGTAGTNTGTAGGAGGAWGAAGTTVTSSGGTGGNAVVLNGKAITWTGGNNGTQVKGAVS